MKNLSAAESEKIFSQIMNGEMNEDEITKFLLALKEKGKTADEILGAVKSLKKHAKTIKINYDVIDVCGTGGDGLGTFNVSTANAFVLAGCGLKVAKHGNRAVSSKSGSSDVIFHYINLDKIHEMPERCLDEANFCYLHAPYFHPILKIIAPVREKLKTRTIFNLVGPLLNPANPKYQLIGVYDAKYLRVFAEVLRELGTKKAWVVNGADGLDEISISGETQICELDKGAIDTFTITPEDAGLPRYDISGIRGGTAAENAQAIIDLLKGKTGAYRDIVLLNAAAGLLVAGKAQTLREGVELAANSINSGAALQVLEKLKKITNAK